MADFLIIGTINMNRIILTGNGFDLSHGLKTGYCHFIDWLWKQTIAEFGKFENYKNGHFETNLLSINLVLPIHSQLLQEVHSYNDFIAYFEKEKDLDKNKKQMSISFKNQLLKLITEKTSLQNWVDIEEEYFTQLKNTIDNQTILSNGTYTIEKLNRDFDEIKIELEKYLTEEINEARLDNFDLKNIGQCFNIADFTSYGISALREEYLPETEEEKIKYNRQFDSYLSRIKSGLDIYTSCKTSIYPNRTLFLNYNYTDLPKRMIECIHTNAWQLDDWAKNAFDYIFIHGQLNNSDYPMIFGYGDEQDEIHKEIEKRGGIYLDNIKTINYLKTQNYKNLLGFIESGLYQVFIWGHSCGLSDKTLLYTLFEHKNCVSIKPFYYIDKNGHNNYDDIIKNIYRCFTNKALMREKVVNKRFCMKL
ncbi:AbiH family protein [Viscerimonas tarda]